MKRSIYRVLAAASLASACAQPSADAGTDGGTVGTGYEGDDSGTGKPDLVCLPGQTRCADGTTLEVCDETGLTWEPQACSEYSMCIGCDEGDDSCTAVCKGPCDSEDELPSSAGCSFVANRMIHPNEGEPDGLMVGNPNSEQAATVVLFQVPEGKRQEEMLEGPVVLEPGESKVFELKANFIDLTGYSRFRTGGNYRVQSDVPVVAYLHSPWRSAAANDASLLLPQEALRTDYVVTSYIPDEEPSYFEVVALEDDTEIEWIPKKSATAGNGFPIPFVEKGKTGTLKMNRYDTARIAASSDTTPNKANRDVSGTIVSSNKPIWVVGAVNCAKVPAGKESCDHLQEQLLPLDYWGRKYVAAPSPARASEPHYWRVYAGSVNGVTVTADPPVIEPIVLEKRGDWVEFSVPNGTAFVLEGDGPFMPVQYLVGYDLAAKIGDPSMHQMVPVEQFLSRYVFVTGLDYDTNYVQIIRSVGGADVFVDDELVSGYYTVADYEVADWVVSEGSHTADSTGGFGIIQLGYTTGTGPSSRASYACPGGMKVEEISIP